MRLQHEYQKAHQEFARQANKAARNAAKEDIINSPHKKAAYRKIAAAYSPPLLALQSNDGKYVTDPTQMDELIRRAWSGVFAGNVADPIKATNHYLNKYSTYLFRADPFVIGALDPDELQRTVCDCSPSAPGMDAWTFDDWKFLPREAFVHLCTLLTLTENGHQWPSQLLHAKAHMLSKDPDDPFNPLAYRLLLITPILYRAWAKLRLSHLQGWIASWALEHRYGGMQGVGASEAWFATAIEVEWSLVSRIPLIGGALDLFKCFDQIMRPLLYAVLRIAGLPTPILTAYMNYQGNFKIYNGMNGALGAAHQH